MAPPLLMFVSSNGVVLAIRPQSGTYCYRVAMVCVPRRRVPLCRSVRYAARKEESIVSYNCTFSNLNNRSNSSCAQCDERFEHTM